MGDADYILAFQRIVMPIAIEFSPELVISTSRGAEASLCLILVVNPPVCAGFDAAKGDDLGECFVSPEGYAHMTHMLSGLAGGRLVVALEVLLVPIINYGGASQFSYRREATILNPAQLPRSPSPRSSSVNLPRNCRLW
jgi:hypothetical protein